MSALAEVDSNGIKTPFFDPPPYAQGGARPITYGSRVTLSCQGIQVATQVMIIERFGMLYVGRVTGFTPSVKKPEGLNAGDFIRFTSKDVLKVD